MEQDLLIDELQSEPVHASTGKRFLNFLIDTIAFYVVLIVLFIPLAVMSPSLVEPDANGNDPFDSLEWNLAFILFFILYYVLFEYIAGGRTPGKLITGTKAVMADGSRLSFGASLKRSLIRLVPFEVFSYFGSPCQPWHDRWADTMVMDIKQSALKNY